MKLKTVEHNGTVYAEVLNGQPVYMLPDGTEMMVDVAVAMSTNDALTKKLSEQEQFIEKLVVDDGLKDALVGVGVNPDLLDGAAAALKPSVKVKRLSDGDRRAIVETPLGDLDLPSFVKGWAADKGQSYLGKTSDKPSASGKSMTRAEFDRLDPVRKSEVALSGIKIVA